MANEQRLIDASRLKMRMIAFATAIKREYLSIEAIVDTIETEDTVDAVEVVHGRWIMKKEPITWCEDDVEVFWECSICQCQNFGESPYCPVCGAKMDMEADA